MRSDRRRRRGIGINGGSRQLLSTENVFLPRPSSCHSEYDLHKNFLFVLLVQIIRMRWPLANYNLTVSINLDNIIIIVLELARFVIY